jgi:uncharacterized protein YjbI with pentapeptide repeats
MPGVLAPILPLRLALFLSLLLPALPAHASCSDAAAPGVNWRRCIQDGQDLSGADLSGATLRDTSFARGQLKGVRLNGTDAANARFTSADLQGADLTGAVLRGAEFTRARLVGAKLVRADLRGARLFRADLTEADLTGAMISGADLSTATLDGARWVDGEKLCAAGSVGTCQ